MAITATGDVTWDQSAFDRTSYFGYRPENHFDAVATVKPTRQAMPGSSVVFNKTTKLAAAVTPLTEATDVTPVTMADTQVTVVLVEQGNAVGATAKLVGTSYIAVNAVQAYEIGQNAGESLDILACTELIAGGSEIYAGAATSTVTVASTHVLTFLEIREARAALKRANVPTFSGGYYAAFIHPDVAFDFMGNTDLAGWVAPHVHSDPRAIWQGELGTYLGFRFVEVARDTLNEVNAGVGGTVDVYNTIFCGQQALAKAWSESVSGPVPRMVVAPVVDKLRRFTHVGWYWLGGYKTFRTESLVRVQSSSSIGAN